MDVATVNYLLTVAPQLVPWSIVLYFLWKLQSNVEVNTGANERFVDSIRALTEAIDLLKTELHNMQIKQERMEVKHEYLQDALTKVERRGRKKTS